MSKSKYYDFSEALRRVQEYVSNNYSVLLLENIDDNKEQLKSYIKKFLDDHGILVSGYKIDAEEINVNSYDDIKITYTTGEILPSKEKFNSPTHAMDVIRRLLHQSGMILDNSQPIIVGHLSDKIRITAIAKGIVDKDVGVSVSIRIVNPRKLTKADFIKSETASEEMLDFLSIIHRYGESMCFTGATSSGKTTLMSHILSTLPDNKRLFTIENGTREFNLVKRDENNEVINNVIHTVTRMNDDKNHSITMAKLLETALTVNPDYICVAEMKSEEAFFAQEAARSGHGVSTTIHASSCIATYYRMVTLCKQKFNMDDETLYNLVTEAFPIVVFCKRLEDNSRKIMEITECVINEDRKRDIRVLYRFNVEGFLEVEGKNKIKGYYEKVNQVSKSMRKRLIENGLSKEHRNLILGGDLSE